MYLVAYCVGNIIGMYCDTRSIDITLLTLMQDPRLFDRKMLPSTDQGKLPSWFVGHYVS